MKRLGFLGAMNRDLVVQQPAAPILARLGIDATPLLETPVSDAAAQRGAEFLQAMGAATYLGGSAFNAARVAALLNTDQTLDLTFFGIAGAVDGFHPHRAVLKDWGMDASAVTISPLPPATCLALVEPLGRTLLTATGANIGVVDWLRQNFSTLIALVARCDVIHVTSFLDPEAPAAIAKLLAAARTLNPQLTVSLDPGMAWTGPGGDRLDQLLRQTQILHLNTEEYAALVDASGLAAIGTSLRPDWLIVARSHSGATLHAASGDQHLPAQEVQEDFTVVDATGAGDTFCGAFMSAYCRRADQPLDAARLGFALARLKIGMNGPLTLTDAVRDASAAYIRTAGW